MTMTRAALLLASVLVTGPACTTEISTAAQGNHTSGVTPSLQIAGQRHQVGFGKRVKLRARVVDGGGTKWTFKWRHLWGPQGGTRRSISGDTLELTTIPPPKVRPGHRTGVLPLSAREAGRIVYEVTASPPSGAQIQQTVEIIPAFPSAGWPRAALGADIYLQVQGQTADWVGDGRVRALPAGVSYLSRLRWPEVSEDGWTTLTTPHSSNTPPTDGQELKVRAGRWVGSKDCGRYDCHPREYRGWRQTSHASVFTRGISGQLPHNRGRYQRHCTTCHTLGRQPGADNDGFDDRARKTRWSFPRRLSRDTWLDIPPSVKERANVQCESCHGPGWFYTGYGDDICAQCHDLPPRYQKVAQARQNRMSQSHRSVEGAEKQTCNACHVGSEFLHSIRGHRSTVKPGTELETRPRGIACPTCHDPHGTACSKQLRLCGEVEIPGLTFDAGQGALCIACHTGEANIVKGSLHRPYLPGRPRKETGHGRPAADIDRGPAAAPHAPQFQILTGRGGKFLRLPGRALRRPVYPHMSIPNTCVGCHASSTRGRSARTNHSFRLLDRATIDPSPGCNETPDLAKIKRSKVTGSCRPCHGAIPSLNRAAMGDYDGDGRVLGILDEVEGLLKMLRGELRRQIRASGFEDAHGRDGTGFTTAGEDVVVADAGCQPLRGPGGGWVTLGPRGSPLYKAAFNYLMIVRDGSGGIHNPRYTVRLLQDTIEGLELSRRARLRHRWKRL